MLNNDVMDLEMGAVKLGMVKDLAQSAELLRQSDWSPCPGLVWTLYHVILPKRPSISILSFSEPPSLRQKVKGRAEAIG